MKKEVCLVLCGFAMAACSRGTETPQTPEMHTQQPTETWSMPGTETERSPTYQTPSPAPGTLDQSRDLPSTDGTGDEGFIIPDDPARDTLGTPGGVDVEMRGTTPGGTTPGGTTTPIPGGTTQPGMQPPPPKPGTPGAPGPGGSTNPGGGANPPTQPGGSAPGGSTNPGGGSAPGGGSSPGGAR